MTFALVAFIASLTTLPSGTVVIGASTIDGTSTDVIAIAPSGAREHLGSLAQPRGKLPKGALTKDGLVTVSSTNDDARAVVEVGALNALATRHAVDSGAVALQSPRVAQNGDVVVVREPREGSFEIARAGHVLAHFDGAWLAPATGDDDVYLAIDRDGENRVVRLVADRFETVASLGRGVFRSLAVVDAKHFVIERDRGAKADVIDVATGAVLQSGLRGMDPRAVGDGRVALGSGRKHGAVVVARIEDAKLVDVVTLDAKQAGVATPLAAAAMGSAVVVVAWLDRGASLPGVLVKLAGRAGKSESVVIAGPEEHAAFEVYGVIP